MKIKNIKKENRPIEKMLANGPSSLSNEELLAILIHTGTKNKSSLDISYELINSVQSFSSILDLTICELMKIEGIKEAKACTIEAAFELTRRLIYHKDCKKPILTKEDSVNILYPLIANKNNEHLVILFLDNKCNLIDKMIVEGALNKVSIGHNEILKKAIKIGARGVVVSHNHPSGNPKPSENDYDFTMSLEDKLEQFDLILFDHIIIGNSKYFSFEDQMIHSFNKI